MIAVKVGRRIERLIGGEAGSARILPGIRGWRQGHWHRRIHRPVGCVGNASCLVGVRRAGPRTRDWQSIRRIDAGRCSIRCDGHGLIRSAIGNLWHITHDGLLTKTSPTSCAGCIPCSGDTRRTGVQRRRKTLRFVATKKPIQKRTGLTIRWNNEGAQQTTQQRDGDPTSLTSHCFPRALALSKCEKRPCPRDLFCLSSDA